MEPKLEYQSRGDDMEVENLKELPVVEDEYNQKYDQPQEDLISSLASRMLALDASNLQVVGYEGGYCWIRVHASCELRLGQL